MPTSEDPSEWQWKPCKLETKIPYGALIRASEESSAIISCGDMSTFVLKPDTTIYINLPPTKRSKLRDLGDKMWKNIKKMVEEGSMEEEMNQAVAGIKG